MKVIITEHAQQRYCKRVLGVENPTAGDYLLAHDEILREWQNAIFINQSGRKIKKQFHDTVFVFDTRTKKLATSELYN